MIEFNIFPFWYVVFDTMCKSATISSIIISWITKESELVAMITIFSHGNIAPTD